MNTAQAINRVREVIRRQHKALSSENSYLYWLRQYMGALRTMPSNLPSEKKLEQFLNALARHRNVLASTQNQAFNAIVFFYRNVLEQPLGNVDALRAQRQTHERHAPTVHETQSLLQAIRNKVRRCLAGPGRTPAISPNPTAALSGAIRELSHRAC